MVKTFLTMFVLLVAFASCISCAQTIVIPPLSAADLQRERTTAVEVIVVMALDETGHETEIEESPVSSSIGSGAVIGVKDGKSLVVTAAHVCHHDHYDYPKKDGTGRVTLNVAVSLFSVVTVEGKKLDALPAYYDDDLDLCVLVVAGVAGTVAEIADVIPPIGAPISYVGAPGAVWTVPGVPIVEGRFSGVDNENTVLSMSIIGGASGSGVFYNNKLFSIVTKHSIGFVGLGYGTLPSKTYQFIKTARDAFYAH